MAKEREKYKAQGVIEAGRREPALEHTGLKEDAMFFVQGPVVAIRWQMAANWPVSYVSPNIRAFGYQPADFVEGRIMYADIIHDEDLPRVLAEVKTYLEEKRRYYEQDYRVRCASGEIRWVHDFTTVIRDTRDTVIHLDGYIADITELRRTQEDLAQSETRYRRVVELAHEGIWIMNARFQTTFVNKIGRASCRERV